MDSIGKKHLCSWFKYFFLIFSQALQAESVLLLSGLLPDSYTLYHFLLNLSPGCAGAWTSDFMTLNLILLFYETGTEKLLKLVTDVQEPRG